MYIAPRIGVLLFLVGVPHVLRAQAALPVPSVEDTRVFHRIWDEVQRKHLQEAPFPEIVRQVAFLLIGQPYVAGLLEAQEEEKLVCSLSGFDCVLFVESVLALAQGIVLQDTTWEGFARRIEQLRYRRGKRAGYCSRMHYFSEWLVDNEQRGHLQIVRGLPGSRLMGGHVNFMSNHRTQYPRLASDSLYACIRAMERRVETYTLSYVPMERIRAIYPYLQDGDIVAFTTSVKGLDFSHTGILVRAPLGGVGMVHASTQGAVVHTPDLEAYVRSVRNLTGIVVARPRSPVGRWVNK